jgi:hypothetical protein
LIRFPLLAVPTLLLVFGLYAFGAESFFGLEVAPAVGPGRALAVLLTAGGWLLEAVALTALFLLVYGRSASGFLDGLFTALCAWTFRGPVLVLAAAPVAVGAAHTLWRNALAWLGLYLLCGLVLGLLARLTGLRST